LLRVDFINWFHLFLEQSNILGVINSSYSRSWCCNNNRWWSISLRLVFTIVFVESIKLSFHCINLFLKSIMALFLHFQPFFINRNVHSASFHVWPNFRKVILSFGTHRWEFILDIKHLIYLCFITIRLLSNFFNLKEFADHFGINFIDFRHIFLQMLENKLNYLFEFSKPIGISFEYFF